MAFCLSSSSDWDVPDEEPWYNDEDDDIDYEEIHDDMLFEYRHEND